MERLPSNLDTINYRLLSVENQITNHEEREAAMHRDLEIRVRALEIGFAKLTAYAAGGAVVGGAAFQLVKMFMTGG